MSQCRGKEGKTGFLTQVASVPHCPCIILALQSCTVNVTLINKGTLSTAYAIELVKELFAKRDFGRFFFPAKTATLLSFLLSCLLGIIKDN